MPEQRFPTTEEFWERLHGRGVEPDLVDELAERTTREQSSPTRLPPATATAVARRLVPDTIPPESLARFLDHVFDRQLGRGDDPAGLPPRAELIPKGFDVLESAARDRYGRSFVELESPQQDDLLAAAERGDLQAEAFDSSAWFRRVRSLVLLGLGSDPRGMVFMGFPGPSYKAGHVWLDEPGVVARARRRRGFQAL